MLKGGFLMEELRKILDLADYEVISFVKSTTVASSDLIADVQYKNGLNVKVFKLPTVYIVNFSYSGDEKEETISTRTITETVNKITEKVKDLK
jgi:hypothetical protein